MAFKKLHTLVAVIGIAVLGGGAWWWQNKGGFGAAASASAPSGGTPAGGPSATGGGAPGGAGGRGPGGPGGPGGPAPVEVGKAEATTLTDEAAAVGALRARQSVIVRPEVSGRIAQLSFVDGQKVRRGQLLVQLDDTLQQAQLKQAEAQASIARTNLQRSRELLGQGFISQSAVDQNAAALQVAEAQVALAQAQVGRMKILSPFEGTAGIRSVNIGDYVKDGADIVSIEDLSSMWVDFRLPERYLPQLRTGLAVELSLDAFPARPFKGRIEALDSQVDANGRSLLVRARVDNPGTALKSGMFARSRVVLSVRESAIVVPEEALVPMGAKQFVYKVVDGEGGQKVAQRVEAKVGLRQLGKAEVLSGLSAGDVIVTAGQARLRGESAPVRIIDLSKPPGQRGGGGRPGGAASGAASGAAGAGGPAASAAVVGRGPNGTAP